jgi:glycerol-3-phosphate cytidylyltransferase
MKIGFACGVFDLFHPGHVLMLKECRENCDHLIVALNTAEHYSEIVNPGKRKPIFTIEERKLLMESCKYVDQVLIYNSEDELLQIMKDYKINTRFLGDDYKGKPITGEELEIEIYYTDRSHGYSTTGILERICKKCPK